MGVTVSTHAPEGWSTHIPNLLLGETNSRRLSPTQGRHADADK